MIKTVFICLLSSISVFVFAQKKEKPEPSITAKDGKLVYKSDAKGNRALDYSYCGYQASSQPIPSVVARVSVAWQAGDQSARIQRAINYIASLPKGKDGFRGAVLLGEGTFELSQPLRITASGIVLRGKGVDKTTLVKKGSDRMAFLRIEGINNAVMKDTCRLLSEYVPVNSRVLSVSQGTLLKVGQRVKIVRQSTAEWIASLDCDIFGGGISALGWKPGDVDICWNRTVSAVSGNQITLDAPLTMALDAKNGCVYVIPYDCSGVLENSGVENLSLESEYNKKYEKDEDHCWTAVSVDNAENCWIRKVNFRHFAGSAVVLQPATAKITVEDCISREPVSEIGGLRRRTFFTFGQQTLFQRCYSEHGIHDFAAGFCAAGPNAFVQCDSYESLGFSGSIDSWVCGLLYDVVNIDGDNLIFKNLGQDKNGAGWNAANGMFWQCTAAEVECYSPDKETENRAYGCWAQFSGNGEWHESNNHIQPRSLFYAQLAERLGRNVDEQARILPRNTSASSSPTVEVAMQLAQEALTTPRLTLERWISDSVFLDASLVNEKNPKDINSIKFKESKTIESSHYTYSIVNGKIVANDLLIVGGKYDTPWWSGKLRNSYLTKSKPAVTRFVPDREGLGLTDCMDSVINYMEKTHIAAFDQNYGLWYDRRRDDHERIRRRNGDVWAPFYEQPFARSGQCTAWDGLSKYDLTRPNRWYYARLQEFAKKAEQKGMLLYNEHYFQHNILEAGAHWVDCPWRSANNINDTQFPEPVPFAGDKRIFVAEYFYDETNAVRRALHRQYIRQNLDAFADCPNVVHYISAEFTGPLHFVQFWIDTINEWEKEKGKKALVALAATKDVQDAILQDPIRSKVVDIIDIRYWHYKTDGIYAPEGGKNLAPRQHARKMKVGKTTFDEAYQAVNEYRTKYPDKAVTFYAQNYPDLAWGVFMAGGSCASLPVQNPGFLKDAATGTTFPSDDKNVKIVKTDNGFIIYSQSGATNIQYPIMPNGQSYAIVDEINPKTGEVNRLSNRFSLNGNTPIAKTESGTVVYWFH